MRVAEVTVEGFRCLNEFQVELEPLTVLVGANGSGKSSLLHALEWFFQGGIPDAEDVAGHDLTRTVRVGVVFIDLSQADREAFGRYVVDDRLSLWRVWSEGSGEKLTGRARAYPPFEAVRAHEAAMQLRNAYNQLREERPDLDLPGISSADKAKEAMDAWEADNPEALEPAEVSATHFFGFTGQPRLAGRFDFVLVPAHSDAERETQDARGTLLRQLLDRTVGDGGQLSEQIEEVRREAAEKLTAIVTEEQRGALLRLSSQVTEELKSVVPDGSVEFNSVAPELRLTGPGVDVRLDDGYFATEVGKQGHGLQRSLFFALVKELAQAGTGDDPPALFLAIEEPELYQHPVQARHFASVLAGLPREGAGAVQVAYATHSEHFVDASRFEQLRRMAKRTGDDGIPISSVTRATLERVSARLEGVVDQAQVQRRVAITMERSLSEAVFARSVLLVEGHSDRAVFNGIADRDGGFDMRGVAVVSPGGKNPIAVAWAILSELGVPVFVLFDGDAELTERMHGRDMTVEEVEAAVAQAAQENRQLLGLFGGEETDWPATGVFDGYAVIRDSLETELGDSWPEILQRSQSLAEAEGDWRRKPADCYREAVSTWEGDVPEFFQDVVGAVIRLAG